MFKNVAAKFMVFAFDSTTNLPKTGDAANITAYVSKDYGTVTVLGDTSATEMDSTNAKGYYLFDAAQAETNADCLMVSAKSSTSNIVVVGAPAVIYTRPTTGWLAPTTAGRTLTVDASGNVTLADAVAHGGTLGSSTATLALSRLSVVSQSSNTAALTVTGNGSGDGADITGGSTGHGVKFLGGATSGDGLQALGQTSGHGLVATGAGTTKHGILATGGSTSSDGIKGQGGGTGVGIHGTGGSTGSGLRGDGGATSGEGMVILANAGNSIGLNIIGAGSQSGVRLLGGATGAGLTITGGGTSGNGITVTTTNGHAASLVATGASKHGLTVTGGNSGTSDGLNCVAGTGGVDIRGNITGTLDTVTTVSAVTGLTASNLDATVSSRLATAGYTVPPTTAQNATAVLTTQMTEGYAADGAAPTLTQALMALQQFQQEKSIASTTVTINKLDGSTPAMTFTLDSATTPTSITRAT
jgi:hypothetical protein